MTGAACAELPRKVLHLFLATNPDECTTLKQQLQTQLERKKPPKVSVPMAISPPTAMAKVGSTAREGMRNDLLR